MNEKKLTIEQAYRAMFYFIKNEYQLTKSNELGGLLGELDWTICNDNGPGDPGAWNDWMKAVNEALSTEGEVKPYSGGIREFNLQK